MSMTALLWIRETGCTLQFYGICLRFCEDKKHLEHLQLSDVAILLSEINNFPMGLSIYEQQIL